MATVTNTNNNGFHFEISVPVWNIEDETGYKPLTTFWQDFSIAEAFGGVALVETLKNCVAYANSHEKDAYKYMTELTMVLNHKIWHHYKPESGDAREDALSRIYDQMWRKVDGWCCDNLKGAELDYFYRTTD